MLKAALTISFPSRASKVTLSTEPVENQNQQNYHDLQNRQKKSPVWLQHPGSAGGAERIPQFWRSQGWRSSVRSQSDRTFGKISFGSSQNQDRNQV